MVIRQKAKRFTVLRLDGYDGEAQDDGIDRGAAVEESRDLRDAEVRLVAESERGSGESH